MKVTKERSAGFTVDGTEIFLHTLYGTNGFTLTTTNLGAAAVALKLEDGTDVLLGFCDISKQLEKGPMFGATLGRYAGRICGAEYEQWSKKIELSKSHGEDHAHGGCRGFDKRPFHIVSVQPQLVRYRCVSPDGEEGYPGTLTLDVTYRLLDGHRIRVEYDYVSDKSTIAGISNHMYFNLLGNGEGDAAQQMLSVSADQFQSLNAMGKPSGTLESVGGTPMDLREPALLSERLAQIPGGIDHDFVLSSDAALPAAILTEPVSGRRLCLWTDMPCLHVYVADFGDTHYPGKDGAIYNARCGVCFEPMYLSDCLHSHLGQLPYLEAGDWRHQETTLQFDRV